MCNSVSLNKKTLKTCIFLVNIELGSAPKNMLIFYHFFQKGRGGGTKKHAFFRSILNWVARQENLHFFKRGRRREGQRVFISVCKGVSSLKKMFNNIRFSGQY